MSDNLRAEIASICAAAGNDRARLMDITKAVQARCGCISAQAVDAIADGLKIERVEVESQVSFYAFLSSQPVGRVVIRLCNDIIDKLSGVDEVAAALRAELGIEFGQTTTDGNFTLAWTPCIGMCDQAPAALVNDTVVTCLTPASARQMIRDLRQNQDPRGLVKKCGDGNNAHELVRSMVRNNVREKGAVIFGAGEPGRGLKNALAMPPEEVIKNIKTSRLRGRGGAGFPAGMKWEFTRAAAGKDKAIICNADEGEPGTFKDRVILTECPDLMFEGMTIAGYAIGAETGILYLRAEYAYLQEWLEHVLESRRQRGCLGRNIEGKPGFNFDIRIQMGAGAYICGEETSLISSCEGLRGDPKTRPPFPAQKGYLGRPTSVNNVETLCCVTRILEKGAGWFSGLGNQKSSGTKLLSVCGDCKQPGVYEVEFGLSLKDLLKKVGAEDAIAVQVGGPSGVMLPPSHYQRIFCFDDLATGGSVMVFGPGRNPLEIAKAFMEFFAEESCGYCTPCRTGNVLLLRYLERVLEGRADEHDLKLMKELSNSVKVSSRCGLGQTSPNPVLSTLEHFRAVYDGLIRKAPQALRPSFDLKSALAEAERVQGRRSEHV